MRRRKKKYYKRKRFWASVILVALAFLWGWGLGRFVDAIPTEFSPPGRPANAIIILTGGSDRMQSGLLLFKQGLGKKVFVTGVDARVKTVRDLNWGMEAGFNTECCVELGYRAEDTYGNAQEAAHWMEKNHFKSAILVTAAYHQPRALLEFRHAMPELVITPYPVLVDHVRVDDWWNFPGTAGLLIGEYHKFILANIGHNAIDAVFSKKDSNYSE